MHITKWLCLTLVTACLFALPACDVHEEKSANGSDKNVDIQTPVGDLHVGNDVDVRDAGLSVYPGAQLKPKKDDDDSSANLSISTSAFGLKVVAAEIHLGRFTRQNYSLLQERTQEIREHD